MSDDKNLNDDLNDMLGDAKEGAKQVADDAKQVLSQGKNIAIIAHITIIVWIIALIMNNSDKTELGSFYIRQMLGLLIFSFVLWFVPVVGWILNLVMLILWILSLIGALGGEKKTIPILGEHFQNWFKGI
jgi:uncharacterized membrane protein